MSIRAGYTKESSGNTEWLACPRCACWFPVAPQMLEPDAPRCICPACHREFRPGAPAGA